MLLRRYMIACLMSVALLTGCSSDDGPEVAEAEKEVPVEELYNNAYNLANENQHNKAAEAFNEVERQHPYSDWAVQAQLMSAYNYYEADNYEEAIVSLDRFIGLHPGNKDIAYAYYLKGLSYYEQISDVGRDQKTTEQAMEALQEVATRFPDTTYARDASLKIDLTRDHLAGKEMEIGRYYLNQNQYLAALNRFRAVVQDYQTTTHVPEALHRMVECYLSLGLIYEAQATAAVLGHNFPGSDWYEDSYSLLVKNDLKPAAHEGSWISQVWDDTF
jgi:outer membrane protein assembly factor BamD